ncbi:RNA polymerase sigma factor [Chondrinema litorale]|uniref:RNA polymerase sigma factor n=1 Tax=Chondrinema litorale TaxID=2994555 RepID=UPI00254387F3|nr:sigma-70 family RNA polymerase sigma factor [Chondrinema litorale]UZR96559.1 sigma-70 family RNA polymerase sigma factor [Chondrinema litorale]
MNLTETDIKTLIGECKEGKRDAQKALYKMHFSFAMSICMRYANSKAEAQEMMNDGFLKVFKYIKKFDELRPFKPWLKTILLNAAIDHLKKHSKALEEVELEEGINESVKDSIIESITYDEMLEIVRKLPTAYRTVFNLRAIEGYQHDEIARMLKISVGTSKSNYARAKKKLQIHLNAYFEVEP